MNLKDKIVAGADESGRGTIIGPMIIGACALDEKTIEQFKNMGLKDSKMYKTSNDIFQHAKYIKHYSLAWSVKTISSKVLTNFNKNGFTMDQVEAKAFYSAIEEITNKEKRITEYQVDNFQAKNELKTLMTNNKKTKEIKLIVLPKADTKYIAVSAGSVLARAELLKVLRELRYEYGDFGSGSTSDKKTITWLKNYYQKNKSWPEIVRTFWKTTKNLEKGIR